MRAFMFKIFKKHAYFFYYFNNFLIFTCEKHKIILKNY